MKKFLTQKINFTYAVMVMLALSIGVGFAGAYSAPGGGIDIPIHLGGGDQTVESLAVGDCADCTTDGTANASAATLDTRGSNGVAEFRPANSGSGQFLVAGYTWLKNLLYIGSDTTTTPAVVNGVDVLAQQVNVNGEARSTDLIGGGEVCVNPLGDLLLCEDCGPEDSVLEYVTTPPSYTGFETCEMHDVYLSSGSNTCSTRSIDSCTDDSRCYVEGSRTAVCQQGNLGQDTLYRTFTGVEYYRRDFVPYTNSNLAADGYPSYTDNMIAYRVPVLDTDDSVYFGVYDNTATEYLLVLNLNTNGYTLVNPMSVYSQGTVDVCLNVPIHTNFCGETYRWIASEFGQCQELSSGACTGEFRDQTGTTQSCSILNQDEATCNIYSGCSWGPVDTGSTTVPAGTQGIQTRSVFCIDAEGSIVDDAYCPADAPAETQACVPEAKTYSWEGVGTTSCTTREIAGGTCSGGTFYPYGYSGSPYQCSDLTEADCKYRSSDCTWESNLAAEKQVIFECTDENGLQVADSLCTDTKPTQTITCSAYDWKVGAIPEAYCGATIDYCDGSYEYGTSGSSYYATCNIFEDQVTCGNNAGCTWVTNVVAMTNDVKCVDSITGNIAADSACNPAEMPIRYERCTAAYSLGCDTVTYHGFPDWCSSYSYR